MASSGMGMPGSAAGSAGVRKRQQEFACGFEGSNLLQMQQLSQLLCMMCKLLLHAMHALLGASFSYSC